MERWLHLLVQTSWLLLYWWIFWHIEKKTVWTALCNSEKLRLRILHFFDFFLLFSTSYICWKIKFRLLHIFHSADSHKFGRCINFTNDWWKYMYIRDASIRPYYENLFFIIVISLILFSLTFITRLHIQLDSCLSWCLRACMRDRQLMTA